MKLIVKFYTFLFFVRQKNSLRKTRKKITVHVTFIVGDVTKPIYMFNFTYVLSTQALNA